MRPRAGARYKPGMTWTRRLDFYIDVTKSGGRACLLDGLSSQQLAEQTQVMQNDVLPVRVYFRRPGGQGAASTSESLPSGSQMLLVSKIDPDDEELLFNANGFAQGTESGQVYYESTLDLTPEAIATAMADKDTIEVVVDVLVQNAANTQRSTFRFPVTINQPVYAGEGDPAPGAPSYPLPAAIMLKAPEGGNYRVDGVNLQIWNETQGKYQTVYLTGVDGETQWNFGAGAT